MDECQPVTFLDVTIDLTPARDVIEAPRPAPSREQIVRAQDALSRLPQMHLEPEHRFADGMYVRTLAIPADTVAVGKTHRHEHPVFLTKGTVTINTDRGMETITAPHTWISPPGAKRVLYTHDDCEFVTVHLNPDNERDLDVIEAYVIEPELIGFDEKTMISEFKDELQRMYA